MVVRIGFLEIEPSCAYRVGQHSERVGVFRHRTRRSHEMKNATLFLKTSLIMLVILSGYAASAEKPEIPAPGVDSSLLKDKEPDVFFSERQKPQECQARLAEGNARYLTLRARLDQLVKDGGPAETIDLAEKQVFDARTRQLRLIAECGKCAMRDIEKREVPGERPELWYMVDGSCFAPPANAGQTQSAYRERVGSLLRVSSYPFYKKGGFSNILEFFPVDPETGSPLLGVESVGTSPFYAFMAIRGPQLLGYQTAFGCYEKTAYAERENGGKHEFVYRFQAERPPQGFRFPEVSAVSASGKKIPTQLTPLSQVLGQWYVRADGYLRYFMAAELGVPFDYAIQVAARSLLEALVEFAERGLKEAP